MSWVLLKGLVVLGVFVGQFGSGLGTGCGGWNSNCTEFDFQPGYGIEKVIDPSCRGLVPSIARIQFSRSAGEILTFHGIVIGENKVLTTRVAAK